MSRYNAKVTTRYILKELGKLKLNHRYKSRSQIVRELDFPDSYLTGNSAKRLQKVIDNYTTYDKTNSRDFIFKEIKTEKSLINKEYNMMTHLFEIGILLNLIENHKKAIENEGEYIYYTSKNDWLSNLYAINNNYTKYKYDHDELKEHFFIDDSKVIEEHSIIDFYNTTDSKLSKNLIRSLDNLEGLNLIEYDLVHMMKYSVQIPNDNEFSLESYLQIANKGLLDVVNKSVNNWRTYNCSGHELEGRILGRGDYKTIYKTAQERAIKYYSELLNKKYVPEMNMFVILRIISKSKTIKIKDFFDYVYKEMSKLILERMNLDMTIHNIRKVIKISYSIDQIEKIQSELEKHDYNINDLSSRINIMIQEQLKQNALNRHEKAKANIKEIEDRKYKKYTDIRIKEHYLDDIHELIDKTIRRNYER